MLTPGVGRHGHHHLPSVPAAGGGDRAFAIGVGLNVAFVAVELGCGLWSGSLALLADAAHNASDVLGLLVAWTAAVLARRRPTARRTYGLGKGTILAALANAGLILVGVGSVSWEAVRRFVEPRPVDGAVMMAVAAVGVVVNTVSALLFLRGRHHDVNQRAAFLHLAADAAVSVGVVISGAAVWVFDWAYLDPATSLAISAVIAYSTWSLLREALDLALDAVPRHIDPREVRAVLLQLDGVQEVHDLHVWSMSSTEVALTAHLVLEDLDCWTLNVADDAHTRLSELGIGHITLQPESADVARDCRQADDSVP